MKPRDRPPSEMPEGVARAKPVLFKAIVRLEVAFQGVGRDPNAQVLEDIVAADVHLKVAKAILEADSHEAARKPKSGAK